MEEALRKIKLFSGTSHPKLASEVAKELNLPLGKVRLERFPDGEISLELLESVRGEEVFILQTLALDGDRFLMELLTLVDALKRASAKSISALLPYYGYSRQDRKDRPRVPITAKLVADMLTQAGVTRVMTIDLHAGQIQGFFNIPVDDLSAVQLLVQAIKEDDLSNVVVVAPDIGSLKLARRYAREMGCDLVVIDKERKGAFEVEVISMIGEVKGKEVLLADDMCTTGNTLVSAAYACQEKGAKRIFASVTHGIFASDALEKIEKSPIERLYVSNTIPFKGERSKSKIRKISIAPLISSHIRCVVSSESP